MSAASSPASSGILIRAGLILAFYGSPLILSALPWQWVFWIPSLCLAALFVANYVFLRNTPREAGLGDYETGDETGVKRRRAPSDLGVVVKKVFASPTMWTIALASMM